MTTGYSSNLDLNEVQWCAPQVSDIAARITGAAVPPGEPLMQAGLDSLAAVDLRRELITSFQLDADALAPTLVFDYPSVQAITEHLLPLLPPPPPLLLPSAQTPVFTQLPPSTRAASVPAVAPDAVAASPGAGEVAVLRAPKRAVPPVNPNAPTLTGCAVSLIISSDC